MIADVQKGRMDLFFELTCMGYDIDMIDEWNACMVFAGYYLFLTLYVISLCVFGFNRVFRHSLEVFRLQNFWCPNIVSVVLRVSTTVVE